MMAIAPTLGRQAASGIDRLVSPGALFSCMSSVAGHVSFFIFCVDAGGRYALVDSVRSDP
jgi:hypothetical protein